MPQMASITINDGQATPVAHTFDPSGLDKNGVSLYHDRSGGVPLGFPKITLALTSGNGTSTVYRVRAHVDVPVLKTASGSTPAGYSPGPAVDFIMRGHVEFVLPSQSTAANRADILAYVKNLLSDAVTPAMVEDLEDVW